ncbi:MAG: T9SS type A sorting domain-containing protein [Ignavibacterium sp.]|nr:T9SS type A sorting domain-containing protein [Ignavibacterium sp.]MDW8375943.1 T9SS type A sorting domain-containing protein [Ignavibacteriales bacterium]
MKYFLTAWVVLIFNQIFGQNFWQKTSFPSGSQLNSVHSLLGIGSNQILAGTFAMGIYKSTDNGSNWFSSGLASQWVIDLKNDNFGNIYALSIGSSLGSGVFKSSDGGNNWTKVWSNDGGLNCLYVDQNNNIYVGLNYSGGQGGVYKSSNGGNNWNKIFDSPANVYSIIKTQNGTLLLAVYENGLAHIYKSSNEGNNWSKYSFPINFTSTEFAKNSSGAIYLSTAGYGIYYSTDNGNTWTNIAPVGPDFSCLHIDGNVVYAGTRGNWVYRSTDGTSNWNILNSGMNQDNYVLSLGTTSNGYLFAGMDYYGIYRSTNQVVATEEEDNLVDGFILNQNYPNPFGKTTFSENLITKISWQSPIAFHTTLKIYDILGNEVETLVDDFRDAGKNEIEFNLKNNSNLSSGIYLYRIRCGNFLETKKMIILK